MNKQTEINPFNHSTFLGYVCEVTAQYIKIQFPSAKLMRQFYHEGNIFSGGNVGNYVVIEGLKYGFLAQISEIILPQNERKEITEKNIQHSDTDFHPIGKAELLLSFNIHEPKNAKKTISRYPTTGSKVYACSNEHINAYISQFGNNDAINAPYAELGTLISNDAKCSVSLDSLFGRHCAVVGTTGGGKSWTTAKLIESIINHTENKVILIDATGEYEDFSKSDEILNIGKNVYFPYSKLTIDDLFGLLKPSLKVQVPKLMEAIRSQKIVKLLDRNTKQIDITIDNNILIKTEKEKRAFQAGLERHISLCRRLN